MDSASWMWLGCEDSDSLAEETRRQLQVDRLTAARFGLEAVAISERGAYRTLSGSITNFSTALVPTRSIPPDEQLDPDLRRTHVTSISVVNRTSLHAARELRRRHDRVLVLNFANGTHPGGGFLSGARAQEESLCRSSALYLTLRDDPMYAWHRAHGLGVEASEWAILSPSVPVFRHDGGALLDEPWQVDFITCAAPIAHGLESTVARALLRRRIVRVLEIAASCNYSALVLGAWGCGAFGNPPQTTAEDFAAALHGRFAGCFDQVVFAITDWSPERRTLGPFVKALSVQVAR